MDIREAAKIAILEETTEGCTVFKTEHGYIIAVADEVDGIYVPDNVTKAIIQKFKTRFFRIHVKQGEIILTPTKVQLEVIEEEGDALDNLKEENNPMLRENLGSCEESQKVKPLGES